MLTRCVCGALKNEARACPDCGGEPIAHSRTGAAAAILFLGLGACTGDIGSPEPAYGIAETGWSQDADGDGYSTGGDSASRDCDDSDADVHPGAEETFDDGVDSNCDGEDDT